MNRVVHFEIHAKDLDKVQQFYQQLFGWNFQDMGPEMGNYRVIDTGKDEPGSVYHGIGGGLTPRRGEPPAGGEAVNSFVCTIEVANLDELITKAKQLGGSIALDKMEVPGVGFLAYLKDPEGTIFGMLQPTGQ